MDVAIDKEQARALVGDAALWPLVRDFLWDFAPQIHESWLDGMFGQEAAGERRETVSSLVSRLSSSPRVKKLILERLGVEPFFHDFPKDDWSRLSLLDGATLVAIAKWLGALACAEELRRVTDGATVRELKSSLRGIYPEVFSFTAYFAGLDGGGSVSRRGAEAQSLSDRVVSTGVEMLHSILSDLPVSLVSRLKFKFPSSLVSRLPDCGRETPDARRAGAVKKLLKLKFPEAYRICCS